MQDSNDRKVGVPLTARHADVLQPHCQCRKRCSYTDPDGRPLRMQMACERLKATGACHCTYLALRGGCAKPIPVVGDTCTCSHDFMASPQWTALSKAHLIAALQLPKRGVPRTFSDSPPLKSSQSRKTARRAAVMTTPASLRFCQVSWGSSGACTLSHAPHCNCHLS